MYLVELRPGKEELYRSGDELAAAIRRGDVDVHSRIYHRATSKWISVTLHPQFKAIVAEKVVEPLLPLEQGTWTYLTDQAETLHVAEGPAGIPADEVGGGGEASTAVRPQAWRRLFGLGAAGVALVLGVQLAFSGPRPPWAGETTGAPDAQPASTTEEPAAAPQVVSLASSAGAWDAPAAVYDEAAPDEASPEPTPAKAAHPRAPRLRLKTLNEVLPAEAPAAEAEAHTIEGLLARYGAAHEAARNRLESGIRVARLNQLFASSRLTPDGGVTATRLGLAGAANFIRVYRQQETLIEREYQDSFAVLSKEQGWSSRAVRRWYGRTSQKEPGSLASLTTSLVGAVDSLLGVLDDQAGAYRLGEGTIAFEDIEASRRYSTLRQRVVRLVEEARAAGGEETPGAMRYLLQAVGTSRLPQEI